MSRAAFRVAVLASLLPLALEKLLPQGPASFIAFVGISYATFRAIDVVICIQDGLITELPAGEYVAFLLFFPAIAAGPIDRYRRFHRDYRRVRTRADVLDDLDTGVAHVFRGILYSFIAAPLIDVYWLAPATAATGALAVVSYMYAYSIHLFFDFAGYSAFAIGVGYGFGVRMPENFDRPFLARDIAEFWNRWHISLSSWLRDHVFGRFVLAARRGHWFADRYTAAHLGSVLAFGAMGLWHGPEARYLVYGFYHALLVVGHGIVNRRDHVRTFRLPDPLARLVTFNLVCFGFLIFSGRLF